MSNTAILDPSWRWTKATSYSDAGRNPSRNEDRLVRRAFRYLCRLNKDDSVSGQFTLEQEYPDLHWAYKIWSLDTGPRWFIEALIISGETSEKIAEYLGQDLKIVKAYEQLFFDVRSKLSHKGYILSQVLAQAMERGMFDREYDFTWKLLALLIGPTGLKNYWDSGKLDEEVASALRDALRAKLLKDALTASHIRRINNYNATEIVGQYLEMVAEDAQTSADSKRSAVVAGLQNLLGSMRFDVLAVDAESDGAGEPRIDKLLETGGDKHV